MKPARARLAMSFATMMALMLLVGACSDDSGAEDPAPAEQEEPGDVAPGSTTLNIADLTFEPTTVPVAAGSTDIAITNADTVDHTFTLDDDSLDQAIAPGENLTVTVELTESLGFHCEIHSSMTGTLEVA